jgi:hypothetical protein
MCSLRDRKLTISLRFPVVALTATFMGEQRYRLCCEATGVMDPAANKSAMASLTKSLCSAIAAGLSKIHLSGSDINGKMKPS